MGQHGGARGGRVGAAGRAAGGSARRGARRAGRRSGSRGGRVGAAGRAAGGSARRGTAGQRGGARLTAKLSRLAIRVYTQTRKLCLTRRSFRVRVVEGHLPHDGHFAQRVDFAATANECVDVAELLVDRIRAHHTARVIGPPFGNHLVTGQDAS